MAQPQTNPGATPNIYQVGGSLPGNAISYVARQADRELWQGIQAEEFCFVLNSRQMGKSSLRVHTMQRLQAEGYACAAIDITKIGSQNLSPEQWYASMIGELVNSFQLSDKFNLRSWWRQHELHSPLQRLGIFIEQELLTAISQPIVIFIDEIDSILSLNFSTDDFFALIRAHYNSRADDPEQRRLTFVLLGVASPTSLIEDKQRTPFNIGRPIPLQGFQIQEVMPLAQGLSHLVADPEAVLREVIHWSGGQPFLTQKLCRGLQAEGEWIAQGDEPRAVAACIHKHLLNNWEVQDEPEHLRTIRNRLLVSEQRAGRLLGLYQQILQQGRIPADDSADQVELRLTGVVNYDEGWLQVYNPIYAHVFNLAWVEKELANLRPYSSLLQAWQASSCTDSSRLLRGQALQDALIWATNKSLSDQDYQFLSASQDQENQEVQQTLALERQEKQAAEAANQILQRAKNQAVGILGIVSLISVGAIAFWAHTHNALDRSQRSLALEQDGASALAQFPSQEIPALIRAMQAGQKLQDLAQNAPLSEYPTTRPLYVLQRILDGIHERNRWQEPQKKVNAGLFNADGKTLLTVGNDGWVRIWSLQGRVLQKFFVGKDEVKWLRLSPDGKVLATVDSDNRLKLWQLNGQLLRELSGHEGEVSSLRFSPDGRWLAATSNPENANSRLWLWNLKDNQVRTIDLQTDQTNSLSFNSDSQNIVTVGQDGKIRLWNLIGQQLAIWGESRTWGELKSVAFRPRQAASDVEQFATVGRDGFLRLWNTQGQQLNQWRVSQTSVYSLGFSPNGQQLFTIGEDNRVRLWDLSGQLLTEFQGHEDIVTSANFSADGAWLLTTGRDASVRLWQLDNQSVQTWQAGQGRIWGLAIDPQGQYLATAGRDGSVRLWPLAGGQPQRIWINVSQSNRTIGINSVAFSPDGQQLVIGSEARQVEIWSRDGKKIQTLMSAAKGAAFSALFSPTGNLIASGQDNSQIQVWQRGTLGYRPETILVDHPGEVWVWGLSFSPDGQYLASIDNAGKLRLWSTQNLRLVGEVKSPGGWLLGVQFTPDSQQLITAGKDGFVRRWGLDGKLIYQFRSHTSGLLSLGLSPDGQSLAVAGQDGTVKVWSLVGQQLAEFSNHRGEVYGVQMSPNGKQLISIGKDDTIRLQQLGNLDQLLDRGCAWLRDYRSLNPEAEKLCRVNPQQKTDR